MRAALKRGGAREVTSRFAMEKIKATTALPIA
jgi:hypothetical protein